jgi:polyisoprenoid-binding protein YceI
MKRISLIIILLSIGTLTFAQGKYFTRSGNVKFFSSTPMENIEGKNNGAICVFDIETGAVEMSMLNTSFEFEKALMQEHFNENYMESAKFPKSTFKGTVKNFVMKKGKHEVEITGDLTIHGVTKKVTVPATLEVVGDAIAGTCIFKVKPEDHGIKIPGMVRDNIAEFMEITINLDLQAHKK